MFTPAVSAGTARCIRSGSAAEGRAAPGDAPQPAGAAVSSRSWQSSPGSPTPSACRCSPGSSASQPRPRGGPDLDRLELRVWEALGRAPSGSTSGAHPAGCRGAAPAGGPRACDPGGIHSERCPARARPPDGWSREAARLGAAILATEERNATARRSRTARSTVRAGLRAGLRQAARVVLESALAQDPGVEPHNGRWGPLGVLSIAWSKVVQVSRLLDAQPRLATPLVAIGAPAEAFYPEVARRLGAQLVVPEHAAVCNAVGAVVGVVSETSRHSGQSGLQWKVFRVHDPAGIREFRRGGRRRSRRRRKSRASWRSSEARAAPGRPTLMWRPIVTERRASSSSGSGDDLSRGGHGSCPRDRAGPATGELRASHRGQHTRALGFRLLELRDG